MRFSFEAPSADGLRVIPEIPNHPLCQIEGRNGIGKTLAARLLELVSGGQPFAALPAAWTTLRNLGPMVIRIHDLPPSARSRSMEFHLDPESWPSEPTLAMSDELGSVLIDGQAGDWASARELLRVVRIAGDETLVETLGRSLQEWSVQAGSALRQLAPVVSQWDHQLSAMSTLCAVTALDLIGQREATEHARAQAHRTRDSYERRLAEAERLTRVQEGLAAALDRANLVSAAAARLEAATTAQLKCLVDLRELEQRQAAVIEAKGVRREVNEAVSAWERRLTLRSKALNKALVAERQALLALELQGRPAAEEIAELLASVDVEIAALKARISEVDSAGTITQVSEGLERQLLNGPAPAMHSVLAVINETPVSGNELVAGLRHRRAELQGHPRAGELDELERRGRTLLYRRELLSRLPDLITAAQRKERNLEEAKSELSKLYKTGGSTAEQAMQIVEQQEEARRALLVAGIELAQAHNAALVLLGRQPTLPGSDAGTDTDDSEDDSAEAEAEIDPTADARGGADLLTGAELRRLAAETDKEAAALLNALGEAELAALVTTGHPNKAADLEIRLRSAQTRLKDEAAATELEARDTAAATTNHHEAAQALSVLRARLRSHVRALAGDEEWALWRPGVEAAFDRAGIPLSDAVTALADADESAEHTVEVELHCAQAMSELGAMAEQIRDAAAQTRDSFGAMAGYLSMRAQTLAPRVAQASDGGISVDRRVGDTLLPYVEKRLAATLAAEELRKELFEDASDVTVDLDRMQIAWRAKDGKARRRPLEAFSSGEQVFAYTRAKLEQLTNIRAKHAAVVIILDEFGAFVARDRFGQLMSFVRHEALGPIADQIIVMLPLAIDYLADPSATAMADAGDDEAGSIADRVRQLRARGYFAVSGEQAS